MLQWMGGGRRKVKTTKKSIQARQHQFFEQRRQQLRSQELIFDKLPRPPENIYSLDIASLKNLSQLAQEEHVHEKPEDPKSLSFGADESKKTLCLEENAGNYQNGNGCGAGSQPASTLDTAAHVRATIGTQWTPASAAAAAALSHPESIAAPQETRATPGKGLHVKDEALNQEQKRAKFPENPKGEKNLRLKHVQKRPSRHHRFEEFQILDLINDSHDSAQRKKDAESENYAAYVLEGMGNVPNRTPKIDKAGYNKTRHKVDIPACNSKHGTQQPPQALKEEKCKGGGLKVQLRRHSVSTLDDECADVTDLESFSDSNGEHCSGECKMRSYDSLRAQYSGEMNIWTRLHSADSNLTHLFSGSLFKEKGFLGSGFTTQPASPVCNGASYQELFDSPKSVGFALDASKFSICSDYESANIKYEMDDYNLYDDPLSDDDLRDAYSSLSSDDGTKSFQFRGSNDDEWLVDDSSSPSCCPTASPQLLFEKAPHDFPFNSPAEEMFSESTFEFQVINLESGVLEQEFQSPSLWERKLDATHEVPTRLPYVVLPAQLQDDNEFTFLNSPKHDDADVSSVGNLTEPSCSIYDKAVDTDSSSLDTIFGSNQLDFASSPTSPLFNQSHHLKLACGRKFT